MVDESTVAEPVTAESSAPNRVHLRGFTIVIFTVVVLAVGTVGIFSWLSYQPLTTGNFGGGYVTAASGRTLPAGNLPLERWIHLPSSAFTLEMTVSVSNRGRYGVTIDRISPQASVLGKNITWNATELAPITNAPSGSFKPTPLGPGQTLGAYLYLHSPCFSIPRNFGSPTFTSATVEYEFLGVHHAVAVPLGVTMTLHGPTYCAGGTVRR